MKYNRPIWILSIMIIMMAGTIVISLDSFNNAVAGSKEKQAKFKKSGNKWKIDPIHASETDVVMWTDSSSDLYFQFMDDSLFGVETATLAKGDTLSLTVKTKKHGIYVYSIFRIADLSFITSDSPPKIIVP